MKILNAILPFRDFLYLLQLEEYDTNRYFKLLKRFFFRRNIEKRGHLVVTQRVKTTWLLSAIITAFFAILLNILSIILIPIWVAIANILLNPVYEHIKQKIQNRAKDHIKSDFNGKIIGIAGSYGKTTTKHFIYELLRYNYKTQMIPGTINTPTGIANWILQELNSSTEILIVEMDSYYIGEIKRICQITPPDIAILTNIADQHLERLGTKKNLEKALLEIFDNANKDASLIFPKEINNLVKKKGDKIIIDTSKHKNAFEINMSFAIKTAELLEIPKDIIADTAKKIEIPDRRGNVIQMHDFETIDASYNISFTTAKAGLEEALKLAKQKGKKLIVITGGIPELGEENKTANVEYGHILSKKGADVIVLKTILYPEVVKRLKEKHAIADSMDDAWEVITKDFNPKKYLVLMQPELGDQYY